MFENSKWICKPHFDNNELLSINPDFGKGSTHIFRRDFTVDSITGNEKISICGLGFYVLKINGNKVGDDLLSPPITSYDKTILYQTYTVAEYLKIGKNEIAVTVANGIYNEETPTAWNFNFAPWRGPIKMICELNLSNETIVSDSSWEASISKTIFSSFREGETYDNLSPVIWNNAKVTFSPGGILKEQEMPSVKLREVIDGKEIFNNIYDFGINITGNVEIIVKGVRGAKVDILYSERIRKDYTLDRENISEHTYSKRFAQDSYILSGEGEETWCSEFTYYSFRYVKITGAEVVTVKARGYFTDLKDNGFFETDNERVNQLHNAVRRSTLTNYVHLPLDCPHREKNGWTADAMLSCQQAMFNFNMVASYLKWLDDFVDCQRADGGIPCIIPNGVWGFTWGNGPTWDAAFIEIVWQLYLHTGRKNILEKYYKPLGKYIDYLLKSSDNYIWYNGLGDWCAEGALDDETQICDEKLLITAYAYYSVGLYAKISEILGDISINNTMLEKASLIKNSFVKKFNNINTNSQGELATVIYFNLSNNCNELFEKLCELIEKDDYHVKCGIFGSKFVLEVLARYGKFDIAWKMLTKEGFPSWMYMIDQCSGTLGEHWNGASSQNHHMFSTVDGFMWHHLVGIDLDETNVGFGVINLKPNIPEDMKKLFAWLKTPYGKLEVEYIDKELKITVPKDCDATLNWNGKTYKLASGETKITK